jgi:hypothetical protein
LAPPSNLKQGNRPLPHSSKPRTINHRRAYSLPSMQQRKPLTWVVLNHLSIIKSLIPYHMHRPLTSHSVARPHNPSSASQRKRPTISLHTNFTFLQLLPLSARTSLFLFLERSPLPSPTRLGFLDIAFTNQEVRGQAGGLLAWCFPRLMAWLSGPML